MLTYSFYRLFSWEKRQMILVVPEGSFGLYWLRKYAQICAQEIQQVVCSGTTLLDCW